MRNLLFLLAVSGLFGCDEEGSADAPPIEPGLPILPPVVEHQPLTAVSGGSLAVSPDGAFAVAGDPEDHQIFVVDLRGRRLRGQVSVPGGEPGRVVVDETHAYVALRTGGVAKIELALAREVARFVACDAPRGLALDGDALHVACAGGELLTLATADGSERQRHMLEPDLRDVVVAGPGRLYVTTFRAAQVLVVEGGEVVDRWQPRTPRAEEGALVPTSPTVAWRAIGLPDGRLAVLHQRAQRSRIVTQTEGGYGAGDGRCSSAIVSPALTIFEADGRIERDGVMRGVLAVDLAISPRDQAVVAAAPGMQERSLLTVVGLEAPDTCLDPLPMELAGQFTSVAADPGGDLLALSRWPLALVGFSQGTRTFRVTLGEGKEDTGHRLFHLDAGGGIACASCHPEGGDDGHTWLFEGVGLRRTQHLRGGLKGLEPFHWEGDLRDMPTLVEEVMVKRMGGQPLSAQHTDRLLSWIDSQPVIRVKSLENEDSVGRGRLLFETSCVGCHLADGQGDGRSYDVGTGGYFQVPALRGLALRAPYMHDGCAASLHDRFGPCGGGDQHGGAFNPSEVDDLVAFLKTL